MASDLVGKEYVDFDLEVAEGADGSVTKKVSEYVSEGMPVVLYIYANF